MRGLPGVSPRRLHRPWSGRGLPVVAAVSLKGDEGFRTLRPRLDPDDLVLEATREAKKMTGMDTVRSS
jgi:hypothetical protein